MSRDAQGSLFDAGLIAPPPPPRPSIPEHARERLNWLLRKLRAADKMPLTDNDVRMWTVVVPNMSRWLPEEEANAICAAFEAEMARLGARR